MSEATLDYLDVQLEELEQVVADPDSAYGALSDDEETAYQDAQQSVVEARRKAETHEGALQVN